MQIGYIGLGKMGKAMVLRLLDKGHQVVAWNRSPEPRAEVARAGAQSVESVAAVIHQLTGPRLIWLMLPAGEVTESIFQEVIGLLEPNDILIEGANSFYKDSVRRAEMCQAKQVRFLDIGVSGGPGGARNGACLMIGGNQSLYQELEPLFQDLSAPQAYALCGPAGAGHFAKMVHNGIEYGMMQAIGEGFEVLKKAPFKLDLPAVAELYNHQSVIESRLIGWLVSGYQQYGPELTDISGTVKHSGEGQWTVETAHELDVPVPIIEGSLEFRINSQAHPSYTGQVVSVLRNQFGGHEVKSHSK